LPEAASYQGNFSPGVSRKNRCAEIFADKTGCWFTWSHNQGILGFRRPCLGSSQKLPLPDMGRLSGIAMSQATNQQEFDRASQVLVGGVNSAVRAFRAVGGTPRFIQRAEGARMWDVEGKAYIDYVGSWGPAIVGHSHPEVLKAVQAAVADGLSFGAPNVRETELAQRICDMFPHVERVRFTSSGTESTMSALRLGRGSGLRLGLHRPLQIS